ncbi:hypothetical protein EMPS_10102 [Entomortierella parvispora]|uniref:Uncharacterized protein n=1 Tax=Entomortierella parvispora TaxID=205924 RepID=A0A9P3HJM6_9FUNG|nr:hypothetical protein EMPS_10102 [Entomortierella parvispora]
MSSTTADAHAARALAQAVLITWLCDRHHDLASLASESLKQRIHFLSLPDRSNLKELCTWDPPSASSSTSCPAWSPAQIDAFIHDSWSPDQLPLHPPKIRLSGSTVSTLASASLSLTPSLSFDSWETTPVLVKQLDEETVQARVPIGQVGDAILVMILSSELESEDENSQSKKVPRWKYHNMVAVSESDLTDESSWKLLLEHQAQDAKEPWPPCLENPVGNLPLLSPAGQDTVGKVGNGEEELDEDDSDDDYWGQYGDTEDESATDENGEGAESSKVKDAQSEAVSETPNDEDDDEDEYWRKYAEQQEEQEAEERKKKLKSQRAGSVGLDNDHQDSSTGPRRVFAELEDPAPTSKIGQVDPNMLSSLLQMLSTQGLHQNLPGQENEPSSEDSRFLDESHDVAVESSGDSSSPSSSVSTSSKAISTLERSLRATVAQAKLDGLSKDQVFEVLSDIYSSSPF